MQTINFAFKTIILQCKNVPLKGSPVTPRLCHPRLGKPDAGRPAGRREAGRLVGRPGPAGRTGLARPAGPDFALQNYNFAIQKKYFALQNKYSIPDS